MRQLNRAEADPVSRRYLEARLDTAKPVINRHNLARQTQRIAGVIRQPRKIRHQAGRDIRQRLAGINRLGHAHRPRSCRKTAQGQLERITLGNLRRQRHGRTLTARLPEERTLKIEIRRDRTLGRTQHKRDTALGRCVRVNLDKQLATRLLPGDLARDLALKRLSEIPGCRSHPP